LFETLKVIKDYYFLRHNNKLIVREEIAKA